MGNNKSESTEGERVSLARAIMREPFFVRYNLRHAGDDENDGKSVW